MIRRIFVYQASRWLLRREASLHCNSRRYIRNYKTAVVPPLAVVNRYATAALIKGITRPLTKPKDTRSPRGFSLLLQ